MTNILQIRENSVLVTTVIRDDNLDDILLLLVSRKMLA